jgi:hypothetical protein
MKIKSKKITWIDDQKEQGMGMSKKYAVGPRRKRVAHRPNRVYETIPRRQWGVEF